MYKDMNDCYIDVGSVVLTGDGFLYFIESINTSEYLPLTLRNSGKVYYASPEDVCIVTELGDILPQG